MPAPSKYQTTSELFKALSDVEGFPYTIDDLFSFLSKTDLKIKESSISTVKRIISPWQIFLKGKPVSDVQTNKIYWDSLDKHSDEFLHYKNLAFQENVANGFTPNEDNSDVLKHVSTSSSHKLLLEKVQLTQQLNGTLSDKPVFLGKKHHTSLSNFKEYFKHLHHLDHIDKTTLNNLKLQHHFSHTNYSDSPWYNFIQEHMILP